MNDENETYEPEDTGTKSDQPTRQPQPPTPKPYDEDDIQTISLLDLMAEMAGDAPQANPGTPQDEQPTQTLFPPQSALMADEEPTMTDVPVPAQPAQRAPVPLPLAPEDMPPQQRPFEVDLDATSVSARVAIPGSRTPDDAAPTQMYRPVSRPPTAEEKATVVVASQRQQKPPPPAREQAPPPVRSSQRPSSAPPAPTPPKVAVPSQQNMPKANPKRRRDYRGCLLKTAVIGLIFLFLFMTLGIATAFVGYRSIASDLPSVADLEEKASAFETARIYDRYGSEIYAQADPNTGNRTRVTLDEISPYLISGHHRHRRFPLLGQPRLRPHRPHPRRAASGTRRRIASRHQHHHPTARPRRAARRRRTHPTHPAPQSARNRPGG